MDKGAMQKLLAEAVDLEYTYLTQQRFTERPKIPFQALIGNLYFLEQEGDTHSGKYAMKYFYNGLRWIWQL